jgi:HEAT repeat protein
MNSHTNKNWSKLAKRMVWLMGLSALIGITLIGFRNWKTEPQHKGKPISYWVNQPHQYSEVREIGAAAVPYLIGGLRTRDSWWRTACNELRSVLPAALRKRVPAYEPTVEIRIRAAQYLGQLGPDAKPAVADLVKLLSKQTAITETRVVLEALRAIGQEAKSALASLRAGLHSEDALVRVETARTIWKVDREPNLVLPIYTNTLGSNGFVPLNSAIGISEMGSLGSPAAPVLVGVLRDVTRDAALRGNSATALGRIGVNNEETIAALLLGIQDPNMDVSGNSAIALWQLDTQYVEVVTPTVVRFAAALHWDSFIKFAQLNSLDLKPAIPALRNLLRDDSAEVRKLVAETLAVVEAVDTDESSDK